ncbi:hypothetical protein QTP70_016380 [Hemibagrus guttatus]|uniref:Tc1-like transposase DDE domain-containing protein n=1 Tax=Hemibagrus guttatus TaxID=175788 RepID=A0AAE0UVA4_9TELE|nr:hypothetical protein QTP70_016380 [Hemibagrus guttatus]
MGVGMSWLLWVWISVTVMLVCDATFYKTIHQHLAPPGTNIQILVVSIYQKYPLSPQDNAPCHKAEMVQEWFDDHNNQFEVLTPPPNSPDLNPIQHLWDVLDKRVPSMQAQPHNLQDLKDLLLTSWCQIPQHTFRDLVESMPQRELFFKVHNSLYMCVCDECVSDEFVCVMSVLECYVLVLCYVCDECCVMSVEFVCVMSVLECYVCCVRDECVSDVLVCCVRDECVSPLAFSLDHCT